MDFAFRKTVNITPDFLKKHGVKGLILDVDNTLTTHDHPVPAKGIREWLENMKNNGIKLIIVSNNSAEQGMFYAARTFAFKLGQSLAMLMFTSIALIGGDVEKGESGYGLGYRLTALLAAGLCLLGGIVFLKYNEKKVIDRIEGGQKNA